jgi:hypothetical protein
MRVKIEGSKVALASKVASAVVGATYCCLLALGALCSTLPLPCLLLCALRWLSRLLLEACLLTQAGATAVQHLCALRLCRR